MLYINHIAIFENHLTNFLRILQNFYEIMSKTFCAGGVVELSADEAPRRKAEAEGEEE